MYTFTVLCTDEDPTFFPRIQTRIRLSRIKIPDLTLNVQDENNLKNPLLQVGSGFDEKSTGSNE